MNTNRLLITVFLLTALVVPQNAYAFSGELSNSMIVPISSTWTGTTSHGYPMSFTVDSNGTMWNTFKVKAYYVATTCYNISGTLETTVPGPGSIANDQFTVSSSSLSGTGQFTSSATATGTYAFSHNIVIPLPGPPYVCIYYFNESGTWTASTSVPAPGDFSKTSPINGATGQPLASTLMWNDSSNATDYEYCIDANNNDTCDTSWISTGTTPSVSVNNLSNNTFYYWQVRANNSAGTIYGNTGGISGGWWSFKTSTFGDVSSSYWAATWIEQLANTGITGGCGTGIYCPEDPVTRAQMAVFLEKGLHYPASFTAPNVAPTFSDTVGHWAEDWIEALKNDGVTAGCATGLYCPENPVTRAQMAVFLLKAKYGSSYTPPAVGASTGFGDVPTDHWASAWIKQLAAEQITGGCGGGNYCPESPVTRAQMAVFLVKTFGLP